MLKAVERQSLESVPLNGQWARPWPKNQLFSTIKSVHAGFIGLEAGLMDSHEQVCSGAASLTNNIGELRRVYGCINSVDILLYMAWIVT